MQVKIDIKSMVLGAALCAVVMLSVAAAATPSSPSGRYQLGVSDNCAWKIDTTTGQVWRTAAGSPGKDFLAAMVGE